MAKTIESLAVGTTIEIPILAAYRAQFGCTIVFRIVDNNHPGSLSGTVTLISDTTMTVLDGHQNNKEIYPLCNLQPDTLVYDLANANGNYELILPIQVESIKINATALNDVRKGKTITFTATVTPADADAGTIITWTSSNPAVAEIDPVTGVATGIKTGTARITATSANGKTDMVTLTVTL